MTPPLPDPPAARQVILPLLAKHATKPAATAAPATPPAAASNAQPPTAAAGTSTGTSTGTTLAAQTTTQLATLESILNLAETGRQALANGDITATIANRRTVLEELGTRCSPTPSSPPASRR